jgi:stromal membrane-associated protein
MADEKLKQRLKQLLALPQNRLCCDCSMAGPTWASKNLGLFVCLDCAGVHRSLGTHVSEVRSVDLDTWVPAWVTVMETVGNAVGNSCWEARMPAAKKITPAVSKEGRANFIREKYAKKAYYSPPGEGTAAISAPVLSAAEQRKQLRLARLNANNPNVNSSSPLPSPTQTSQPEDLFSGMTVKSQTSRTAAPNLFDGMNMSSSPSIPLSLSPASSTSASSFDLLNLDAIAHDESGFSCSRSPVAHTRQEDPFAEFITL